MDEQDDDTQTISVKFSPEEREILMEATRDQTLADAVQHACEYIVNVYRMERTLERVKVLPVKFDDGNPFLDCTDDDDHVGDSPHSKKKFH
jgi:hypothetical protein